ncbi:MULTISPECIES: hypothetical protein [Parafrankia]|nr:MULTISPECIES: hypothetical protein [Parafrankia]
MVTLAACDSGDAPQPVPTPTGAEASIQPSASVSPMPTAPAVIARRDAVAAYLGMWQKYTQASHTSDWQASYLSQYAAGDALQFLSRDLYADHYNGLVSKGAPVNSPQVTSVSPDDTPTWAMIDDCVDARHWLRYRADGSLLDDKPGALHKVLAEVRVHTDGKWRVTRFGIGDPGSC